MKRIRNGLYLVLCVFGFLIPLQVSAAGRDAVIIQQQEARVAVSVNMTNALEENITAVSISLKIEVAEGTDRAMVLFDFAPELAETEHDIRYENGILSVYAASGKSLFQASGELALGYVRVEPKDPSQVIRVQISYEDGSFQTANRAYGSKEPDVSRISDPVDMQVGAGVIYGSSTQALEEYLEQAKSQEQGNYSAEAWAKLQEAIRRAEEMLGRSNLSQSEIDEMAASLYQAMVNGMTDGNGGTETPDNNTGNGTNGDNQNQGLYDPTTQFVNDPADAKKIPSPIIREDIGYPALIDLSQGVPGSVPGGSQGGGNNGSKSQSGGNGGSQAREDGKVSVVAPEDGPSSILITEADDKDSGETTPSEDSAQSAQEEILLDQEGGGVKKEKDSFSLAKWMIPVGVAVVLIAAIFLILIMMRTKREKEGKKGSGRKRSGKNR